MSTFKFAGDEAQGGLPRGSRVRIEEAQHKSVVFEGKVTEAAYIDLDPGKYCYSVVRLTGDNANRRPDDVRYDGEFLHEVSEQTWKQLRNMNPGLSRTLNTSEGARWKCLVKTCGEDAQFTTPMAALIHEVTDHLGIPREKFLENPGIARSKMAAGGKYDSLVSEVGAARNRAPRKQVVLGVSNDDLVDDAPDGPTGMNDQA